MALCFLLFLYCLGITARLLHFRFYIQHFTFYASATKGGLTTCPELLNFNENRYSPVEFRAPMNAILPD